MNYFLAAFDLIIFTIFFCFLHFQQRELRSKSYGIALIDSIVISVDHGDHPYRRLFGEKLPMLIKHVLVHAHVKDQNIHEILCEARQSWEGIFTNGVLEEIDDAAREVYKDWLNQIYKRGQLITELNKVKDQLAKMQKEVNFLEMQANEATNQDGRKPKYSNANSIGTSYQIRQNNRAIPFVHVDFQSQIKINKRFSPPKTEELPLPKRTNCERNFASPIESDVNKCSLSQSSVLLTPSPEPQDRLSPTPSLSTASITNTTPTSSSSNFWMSMMKNEKEQELQLQQKQQSPKLFIPLLDENVDLLF